MIGYDTDMMNSETPTSQEPQHLEKAKPTVAQQLKEFERQGYVFHGSTNPNIVKLEPRPATDVDTTKTFNNDTAVFAAPSPTASVIFACMSLDKVPKEIRSGTWSVGSENGKGIVARIPQKWKQFVVANSGYIYVLDGSTFSGEGDTEGGWQVKSKQPVKPTTVLTVTFSDFEQLGGSVIWKEDD